MFTPGKGTPLSSVTVPVIFIGAVCAFNVVVEIKIRLIQNIKTDSRPPLFGCLFLQHCVTLGATTMLRGFGFSINCCFELVLT